MLLMIIVLVPILDFASRANHFMDRAFAKTRGSSTICLSPSGFSLRACAIDLQPNWGVLCRDDTGACYRS